MTDLTFVLTWAGVAYVCFITDVFSRMIVGWCVAGHMRTTMVLASIEMARWARGYRHPDLRCHSDVESPSSPRFGTADASRRSARSHRSQPSRQLRQRTGRDGQRLQQDRDDPRALAIRAVEDRGEVELATWGWVHWHNHQRLHSNLGDLTPIEFEAEHYAPRQDDQILAR